MNMAEYGSGLRNIGLQAMADLADLENRRRLERARIAQLEAEAKGGAVGSMVGMGLGAVSSGIQESKRRKSQPINGLIDGMRDKDEAKPEANDPIQAVVEKSADQYEPYQPLRTRQLNEVRQALREHPEAITAFQDALNQFPTFFISNTRL